MKPKNNPKKIFIVEDDPLYIKIIKYVVELDPEHEVHVFETGKACIDNLYLNPSFVTLDYTLPDMTGDEVMDAVKKYNPNIGIIVLSGQNEISIAVDLMKKGAFLYIPKNEKTKDTLQLTIQQIKKQLDLQQEIQTLKEELSIKYDFQKNIIGGSKPMKKVYNLMSKAIQTDISVTIQGETGTGKEVVARSIHYNSNRKNGKFVAVNVSAIPKELLESELFGHEKGAFTGANNRKIGKFELANNGTLFLDEIAELDISLQAKLLRALQEREINRVGGNQSIKFDARLIVASHRNLVDEIAEGNFREDLYYRLLGLPITMPPLRERGNDLFLLADFFLKEFCTTNRIAVKTLSKESKEKLIQHPFLGNVRELKAVMDLAAAIADGNIINPDEIQFNGPSDLESILSIELSLKEYNHKIINHFLGKYNHDVLLVAKKLNIGKSTIYRMLKE